MARPPKKPPARGKPTKKAAAKSPAKAAAKSEKTIDDDAIEILGSLPEDVREKVMVSLVKSEFHSGPIPPASEIEALKKIKPNFPERIFRMAEKEQAHRHNFDNKAIRSYDLRSVLSFLLGLCLIGSSVVAIVLGYPITAIPLGIFGVIGTIVNAILRRWWSKT